MLLWPLAIGDRLTPGMPGDAPERREICEGTLKKLGFCLPGGAFLDDCVVAGSAYERK